MTIDLDDLINAEVTITEEQTWEPATSEIGDFPAAIDNTMRSMYAGCNGKFALSSLANIQPQKKSIHLSAGGAFARGVETVRRSYYRDGKSPDESLGIGLEALIGAWGPLDPENEGAKTLDRMLGALEYYFAAYPIAQDYVVPYDLGEGNLGIEFSFALPLPIKHPQSGDPIIYAGRFDMLGQHRNGSLMVVDEKTTSRLGATWSGSWDLDSQFTGYITGARSYSLPVVGAVIRGVSILKTKYETAEAIVYRDEWEIQRWYGQLIREANGMVRAWRAARAAQEKGLDWIRTAEIDWALDKQVCASYGGCQYKGICTKQDPSGIIPIEFAKRIWNPLEREHFQGE